MLCDHGVDGAETDVIHMSSMFQVLVLCAAGELDRARALVADTTERAAALGTAIARAIDLGNRCVLAGWTGAGDEARRCGRDSLALCESIGSFGESLVAVEALGRLEISLGNCEAAVGTLVPAFETVRAIGCATPIMPPLAPDAVEALLGLDTMSWATRCRGCLPGW